MWILVYFLCICFIHQSELFGWIGYSCLGDKAGLRYSHVVAWTHSAYLPQPPPSSLQAVNQSADSDLHRDASVVSGLPLKTCPSYVPVLLNPTSSHKIPFQAEIWGPWKLAVVVKPDRRNAMARCVMQHLSDSLSSPVGDINLVNSSTTFFTVASSRFCLFAVPHFCTPRKHPDRCLVSFCYYWALLRVCRPPPPQTSRGGRSPTTLVFTVVFGDLTSHWLHFNSGFFF